MDAIPGKVQVRIQNATASTLENVTIVNTGYGNVTRGQVTNYKILDQPIYAGYCLFTSGGVQNFAGVGVCGSPPPPPFSPGNYTFKVLPAVNGYNEITVIKE